jgi:stringent starvation protein B
MTSNKPYLIRAIYEWITDNLLTPYLLVNTSVAKCEVPQSYISKDKTIIFNIEASVVEHLALGNKAIEFTARFSGNPFHIYIPISAVVAIYVKENGVGMSFPVEKNPEREEDGDIPTPKTPKGKPDLKIVR